MLDLPSLEQLRAISGPVSDIRPGAEAFYRQPQACRVGAPEHLDKLIAALAQLYETPPDGSEPG